MIMRQLNDAVKRFIICVRRNESNNTAMYRCDDSLQCANARYDWENTSKMTERIYGKI